MHWFNWLLIGFFSWRLICQLLILTKHKVGIPTRGNNIADLVLLVLLLAGCLIFWLR